MKERFSLKDNKKLIIEIISVVSLLSIVIGISFAGGYWSYISSKDNTITTGNVSLTYLESSSEINLVNALPMSDNEGKLLNDKGAKFEFAVTTNSDYVQSINYDLNIETLIVDTGKIGLDPSDVKVYLTDKSGNVLVQPTKISDLDDFKLYTKKHKHTEGVTSVTSKYVLRAWIDKDVEATNWHDDYVNDKQYQYKFRVNVSGGASEIGTSAADELIKKVGTSGLEVVTHSADSTLQIGATEDLTEYRYRGGNDVVTNNYVYFNCSDINTQTADTCELYRIIGVFPTDDGTGNIENRVKLIKAESYGDYEWNTNETNNWTEASLNTILNTTYWNTINSNYKTLVGNAKYYLGGNSEKIKTDIMYQSERKTSGSDYYYNENPNSWDGKIALMYASDYGYGANSTCSENKTLLDYSSCTDNSWLYLENSEWLLVQYSSNYYTVFSVDAMGYIGNYDSDEAVYTSVFNNSYATRPVFYLNSDASFNGVGDGSSTNPYQLSK